MKKKPKIRVEPKKPGTVAVDEFGLIGAIPITKPIREDYPRGRKSTN